MKILISVINNENDVDLLLNESWYRIPVRFCPVQSFKFIAFYETKRCRNGGKINYFAEIKSTEDRIRHDFMGLSGQKKDYELYRIFHLNDIKKLNTPISNNNKMRVTFILTTMHKFKSARDLMDIFDVPDLEGMVESWLEEMNIEYVKEYTFKCKSGKRYRFDFAVMSSKYLLDIECDSKKGHSNIKQVEYDLMRDREINANGWNVLRFSEYQIINEKEKCINVLNSMFK